MRLFKNIMSKIIHIFDMDDTLLETPTFANFVGASDGEMIDTAKYFPEYFQSVKSNFLTVLSKEVGFKKVGDFVVPVNMTNGKMFGQEILQYFKDTKNFLVKDGVVTLQPFPGFHSDVDTIGMLANEGVLREYEMAANRMILTGRPEAMREKLNYIFKYLGITYPNHGLMLFEQSNRNKNVLQYKVNTILDSIKKNMWAVVHFYEDRLDWLQSAKEAVESNYPEVQFIARPITNIKEKRSL